MTITDMKMVIETIISLLEQHYVVEEKVNNIRTALKENVTKYELEDVEVFCKTITQDLQEITSDKHLTVFYRPGLPQNQSLADIMMEDEVKKGKVENYGFHKVERLPGNIGYIDLRKFYSVQLGAETVVSIMNTIAHTDALMIDLRKNGGGRLEMVTFLTSYFLDKATHVNSVYNRSENTLIQEWTHPYVPGKRYLDKPIYVLTSPFTFSGGEALAYSLQHLNKAKIVGEVTGGGAHPVMFERVDGDIHIRIPNRRSINPVTNSNWEGIGVIPDFPVEQENAFHFAYKQALTNVKEKYEEKEGYAFLLQEVDRSLNELVINGGTSEK